ncbi:MAG: glycosyltransferase family 39 protein [Bacillota bacterium]
MPASSYIPRFQKFAILAAAVLMGISNLHFLSTQNLHPDEAYYWVWSRHLDIGYFDNSPFVAYVIRLFTTIGRNNEFWDRLPAFLGWVFFLYFVFKMVKLVYLDQRSAWLGVLVGTFVPLVASGSHIMTHDIPMIFFATLTWFFLYLAIEREQKSAWYWGGVFFGMALFSKFQAVLIGLAVLTVLLTRSEKRRILLTKEPYLAVLIAFLMFLPVLYWNWQHHWAAFLWQSQHGIHREINFHNELEYLGGQLGVFSLLFLVLLYYTIKRIIGWKKTSSGVAYLITSFLPVFIFFGLTSLTFAAEPNWPAVGYFPAVVFLSGELAASLRELTTIKKRLLQIFIGLSIAFSIFLLSFVRYPQLIIELGWDMNPDLVLTNGTYGWDQLGKKVDSILTKDFPSGPHPVPVFGDSYQTAAELQFYVKKPVVVFTTRQAHRSHFDFVTAAQISKFNGQPGLLVLEGQVPANAARYFDGIVLTDTLTISRFHHDIRNFYIYSFQKLNAKALHKMAVDKPYGYPGEYPD